MHILKVLLRSVIFAPQMLLLYLRGVPLRSLSEFEQYTSFFRHFPFASIDKNGIVSFRMGAHKVKMTCGELHPRVLIGTFRKNDYGKLLGYENIAGKDVVDVGAALGDTLVFFGLEGARSVYGYEIVESLYKLCEKNIALNGLEKVCHIEWCGIGGAEDYLSTSHPAIGAFMLAEHRRTFNGVPLKSLRAIVKEHQIKDGILKIDVDGLEYEIMAVADAETLRRFSHIVIEYHFGVKDIATQLQKCGFKVSVTAPVQAYINYHPEGYKDMEVGYITAVRIDL